jgi:arylsulfatase A-like enzyme
MAAVASCDDNFGKLLDYLNKNDLADNTIVIFTSDHGEMMGSHGRYAKSVWYDESIGIPFIIRWPGRIKPRHESMPFSVYNFMPTILGLMSIKIPDQVEGTDYSNYLLGGDQQKASAALITSYGNPGKMLARGQKPSIWALQADSLHKSGIDWRMVGYRGLRTERYTYVVDRGRKGDYLKRYLYDNQMDPYQLEPEISEHPENNEIMVGLDSLLQIWLDKTHDPFLL